LVLDLFSGLGGFSEGFIANGFRAIGFDIEAHDYGDGGYPGQLVLRDVRSLCGAELVREYGIPAVIVASPPCQEFSYMAMPWSKAKEKMRKILADPAEQTRLTDLFNQCFRIQREVSAAAGCDCFGDPSWPGKQGGVKQSAPGLRDNGKGSAWFGGPGTIPRMTGSRSPARKRASAEIAKIPPALSSWLAKCFKPKLSC
jgi:hypothetical protein